MSLTIVLIRILRKYLKRRDFLQLISTNKSNRVLLHKIFLREYYIYYNPQFKKDKKYLDFIKKCDKIDSFCYSRYFINTQYLSIDTSDACKYEINKNNGTNYLISGILDLGSMNNLLHLKFRHYKPDMFQDIHTIKIWPKTINIILPATIEYLDACNFTIDNYPDSLKGADIKWKRGILPTCNELSIEIYKLPRKLGIFENVIKINITNELYINTRILDLSSLNNLQSFRSEGISNEYYDNTDETIWKIKLPKSIIKLLVDHCPGCKIRISENLQKLSIFGANMIFIPRKTHLRYLWIDDKISGYPPKSLEFLGIYINIQDFFRKTKIGTLQIDNCGEEIILNVENMRTKRISIKKEYINRLKHILLPKRTEYLDNRLGYPDIFDKLRISEQDIEISNDKYMGIKLELSDYFKNLKELYLRFDKSPTFDLVLNRKLEILHIQGEFNKEIIFTKGGNIRDIKLDLDKQEKSCITNLPITVRKLYYSTVSDIELNLENTNLETVYLGFFKIDCKLPDTVRDLTVVSEITNINIPNNVTDLTLECIDIQQLPKLPNSLLFLHARLAKSIKPKQLPRNLSSLTVSKNCGNIDKLLKLPINIVIS